MDVGDWEGEVRLTGADMVRAVCVCVCVRGGGGEENSACITVEFMMVLLKTRSSWANN